MPSDAVSALTPTSVTIQISGVNGLLVYDSGTNYEVEVRGVDGTYVCPWQLDWTGGYLKFCYNTIPGEWRYRADWTGGVWQGWYSEQCDLGLTWTGANSFVVGTHDQPMDIGSHMISGTYNSSVPRTGAPDAMGARGAINIISWQ